MKTTQKKKAEKQGKRTRIKIEMPLELYAKMKRASKEAGLSMGEWIDEAVRRYRAKEEGAPE